MNKIFNVEVYIHACSRVLDIPVKHLMNRRARCSEIKWAINWAKDYGFSHIDITRIFNKRRTYIYDIKNLNNNPKYLEFSKKIEKEYKFRLSEFGQIEKFFSHLNSENKRKAKKIEDLNFEIKNQKEIISDLKFRLKQRHIVSSEILENLLIKFQYEDNSRGNAKYLLEKLTKEIFPDMPVDNFYRREYFAKKITND